MFFSRSKKTKTKKKQKKTKQKQKKKKNVEQEEIFEDFWARSKFEQDFACPKSTKSTTLTKSFDISKVNAVSSARALALLVS